MLLVFISTAIIFLTLTFFHFYHKNKKIAQKVFLTLFICLKIFKINNFNRAVYIIYKKNKDFLFD